MVRKILYRQGSGNADNTFEPEIYLMACGIDF